MKRTLGLRPFGRRGTVALLSTDVPEEPRPATSKKNTRRWCRGKEGVEHAFAWTPVVLQWGPLANSRPYAYREECAACGRRRGGNCWAGGGGACRCGHHGQS